jgi:uncharacterized protein
MTRKVFRDKAAEESHRTLDLQPSKHAGVFANEKIGLKRYRTPEGYLFCEDVPIARTDEMIYGPGEVPVQPGSDGYVRITRDAKTLFDANTLLSYQGKPITNDHPDEDVNPGNWKTHSVGVVLNPRQGVGEQADIMLADFLVTDARAIKDIEDGKVEVSCGYDAMYEQIAPGKGIQTDIVGNHVALVDRGRCGPRCAIGDRQTQEEDEMKTRDNASAVTANETDAAKRIRRQFNDAAEAAIKELPANEGVNVHVHLGTNTADKNATPTVDKTQATLDALVKTVSGLVKTVSGLSKSKDKKVKDADPEEDDEKEDDDVETNDEAAEEEEKEEKKETKDSAALATSYKATLAGAEVLVPGIKVPTFDAAKPRKVTMDSLCKVRTLALDRFASSPAGMPVIASLTGGKGYDSLTADCKDTAALFKSAVAVQMSKNNFSATGDSARMATHDAGPQFVGNSAFTPGTSVAAIAERHKKYWEKHGVRT